MYFERLQMVGKCHFFTLTLEDRAKLKNMNLPHQSKSLGSFYFVYSRQPQVMDTGQCLSPSVHAYAVVVCYLFSELYVDHTDTLSMHIPIDHQSYWSIITAPVCVSVYSTMYRLTTHVAIIMFVELHSVLCYVIWRLENIIAQSLSKSMIDLQFYDH